MAMQNSMYTPRELAAEIVLGWVKEVYHEGTSDLANHNLRDKDMRKVKVELAKLHNRLMGKANLNGLPLDELI